MGATSDMEEFSALEGMGHSPWHNAGKARSNTARSTDDRRIKDVKVISLRGIQVENLVEHYQTTVSM
jgi:hypothetical protein